MRIMTHSKTPAASGFTITEMAVSTFILALLGLIFFQVLQSGLVLSAKNTAVNAAHQEARDGVMRLTRDIHASISVPQLRDTNFAWVSATPVPNAAAGTPPPNAAGVSFQNISAGPNYVFQDPGNPNLIMIRDKPTPPEPGMRLIVPAWAQEDDIAKVTSSGSSGHSNVFTVSAIETNIKKSPVFFGTTYAIVYYTNRAMYLVRNGSYVPDPQGPYTINVGTFSAGNMDRFALQDGSYVASPTGTYTIDSSTDVSGTGKRYRFENGELHFYLWRSTSTNPSTAGTLYWKDMAIVARYISSPKPFSVPLNRYGSSNNKYVNVKLTARDPKSSNRGYIATASLLNTDIDYRSRLTLYQ